MTSSLFLFNKHHYRPCLIYIFLYFAAPTLQAGALHDLSYVPADILAQAEQFKTEEYRSHWALDAMNAAVAYAYGATGQGQTIALIDSSFPLAAIQGEGILAPMMKNKVDFPPEVMQPSFDELEESHSYRMATLIVAKKDTFPYGNYGIAFDSKIMSYNAYRLDESIAHALKHNIKIFNNSWKREGSAELLLRPALQELYSQLDRSIDEMAPFRPPNGRTFIERFLVTSLNTFKDAVQSGAVFVWAAGNEQDSQPQPFNILPLYYPTLKKGWLSVVATNKIGYLASYSNRCGQTKAWCLAAPGGEENVPAYSNFGITGYGTSAAAAYVSGAIALLKSRFPTLSEQDIAARLLYTANKKGIYANQEIYGQGVMDLAKASMPVGETYFVTGGHAHSPETMATQHSFLSVIGHALEDIQSQVENSEIFIFDQFQRAPFKVSLAQFIRTPQKPTPTLLNIQRHFDHLLHQQKVKQGEIQYQFSLPTLSGQLQTVKNLLLTANTAPTEQYGFYLNQDGGDIFGQGQRSLYGIRYAKNPYLSFSQQGIGSFYQKHLGKNSYIKMGFSYGNVEAKTQETQPNQGKDYYAAQIEVGRQIGNVLFSSQYAAIQNKQGLFQLAGQGGLALADQTYTQVMHAGVELLLKPTLSWKSHFYHAFSQAKSSGMIQTHHTITSQAFHSGLHYQNHQQAFGLYVYQPLTITKGKMKIRAVTAVNPNGQLLHSDYEVNLKHRRRYQLEAFYHHHFKQNAQLVLHTHYGKHSKDNAAYVSYLRRF
jgi:subtilase-type serine protease